MLVDRVGHFGAAIANVHAIKTCEGIDITLAFVIFNSNTLAWSPDSRSLIFRINNALKRLELAGGPAQTLCDCQATGASVNGDGVILMSSSSGIQRLSSVGGGASPVPVVTPGGPEERNVYPLFLPDGRHFLYLRSFQDASQSGIFLGDLHAPPNAQSPQRLLATEYSFAYAPSSNGSQGRILFLRNGTLMVQNWNVSGNSLAGDPIPLADQVSTYAGFYNRMTVSANGILVYRTGARVNTQLTWLDRNGKTISTVGPPDLYNVIVVSPDGTKAVVNRTDGSGKSDFWTVDLTQGASTRVTTDPGSPGNPVISPDGSTVIYGSFRNRTPGIYRKPVTGAGIEEVILSPANSTSLTDLSRDGRFLLYFAASRETGNDLWVLPLEGNRKPFPYLRTPYQEIAPRLSSDGRWIAYISTETGRREVYVKRFIPEPDAGASAAAGKWLVSRNGAIGMVRWRKDGKELYYLSADSRMMAVDVSTTSDFRSGALRVLFTVPEAFVHQSGTPGSLADISSDGKRFLFALPVQQNQAEEFKVVLNWESALKK